MFRFAATLHQPENSVSRKERKVKMHFGVVSSLSQQVEQKGDYVVGLPEFPLK